MEFNSIEERLRRINISTRLIENKNYLNDTGITYEKDEEKGKSTLKFHFGSTDDQDSIFKILSVVSVIAELKDNLKNKMIIKGLDKQLVEDEINNNIVLCLITDLDNQRKHGMNLNHRRYKKGPLDIVNITTSLRVYSRLSNNIKESVKHEFDGGTVQFFGGDNSSSVIIADIVNKSGDLVCELDDMIDDSIKIWTNFIAKHKLLE